VVVPFLPYVVVGALHVVSLLFGAGPVSDLTKPLLMPALLVAFLVLLPRRRGEVVILGSLAILFGWFGDLALMDARDGFLIGLCFFLVGHLAYVLLIWRRMRIRSRPAWWSAIYPVWWVALVGILAPHTGSLIAPLAVYGVVLGALAISGSACNRWIAIGSASFLISDTLLGLHRFLPGFSFWPVDALIMLTYLAGQGLIVWGVLVRMRSASPLMPALLRPGR